MSRRLPRRIAPRLRSGDSRDPIAHGLPPHIKTALKMIAAANNESVSWLLEKALIEYFKYDEPDYVARKSPEPGERATRRRKITTT